MCDLILPLVKLVCQNNVRRTGLFFLLLITLIIYSLHVQRQLHNPYHSQKISHSFTNLSCPTVETSRLKIYDVTAPYKADFPCVHTKTRPSATVCFYSEFQDMYISHDLQHTRMWEPQVANDLLEVLHRDPLLGLIDIGANVGFYTMLAAVSGHKVVAVEPNINSIYRIHHAVQLEGVAQRVTVVHSAVTDTRTNVTVRLSGDNQGDTRVEMSVRECIGSCPPVVPAVIMNDLIQVAKFSSAVIKIDAQGFEHRVFKCASALFDALIVRYVFMEWLVMKEFHPSKQSDAKVNTENNKNNNNNDNNKDLTFASSSKIAVSYDLQLIQHMLRFFLERNYRPYSLNSEGGAALDPAHWWEWPNDIVWHLMPSEKDHLVLLYNRYKNWPR